MKLWILKPKENVDNYSQIISPWNPWYDKFFGFVIRAESEERARKLAGLICGDEGDQAWLDSSLSICKELLAEGNEEVVITDFHAA